MKVYQIQTEESWRDYYGTNVSIQVSDEIYRNPPELPGNYNYIDSDGANVFVEYSIVEKEVIEN